MKRLVWLVGPPGAGKSTFIKKVNHGYSRVAEFNSILFPLLKNTKINSGVKTANNQLVQLIRELELRAENIEENPLLVVAGIVNSEILFPLSSHEEVWLLLPIKDNWKRQFELRPIDPDYSKEYFENYDDYSTSEKAYDTFRLWLEVGLPIKQIEFTYDISLLGKRHYDLT